MQTTRTAFLRAAGVAAAHAAPGRPAKSPCLPQQKQYATALTPCDNSLEFATGARENYPRPKHRNATEEQKAQIKYKPTELGLIA